MTKLSTSPLAGLVGSSLTPTLNLATTVSDTTRVKCNASGVITAATHISGGTQFTCSIDTSSVKQVDVHLIYENSHIIQLSTNPLSFFVYRLLTIYFVTDLF